ncbi:unnamed protein product [Tilletia controversa]|uniref:FAD dependent oxidoreductase domain-containing protein n=3 Tax=Tilletia TaxID=13289 RepID=A0A8X7MXZ2_9BASI|nr:hypothetical protein CF336_g1479 [Tilletia laevis]KAE8203252.1 hypothetical protein CF328_g1752 [Tilletia controversa]KAE8262146.1 hypothetical protein A4X03_0g2682 [Tilletia caries]KAE8207654.1 hypothetical protein CF335_g987 [Tilletia laevis]KAE8252357.1 hypothetical protein A4X06_0g2252 [Tilletia controversa]
MTSPKIVVLGGGVIGLSVGITLLEREKQSQDVSSVKVILASEHLPREVERQLTPEESQTRLQQTLQVYPASYASVWAGAHHVTDTSEPFMGGIVKRTYNHLVKLEKQFSQATPPYSPAPLYWVDQIEHFPEPKPGEPSPPWKGLFDYYPDFRVLDKTSHSAHGCAFRTLDIDTRTYLPWLLSRFRELGGVVLPSFRFASITSALSHPSTREALAGVRPDAIVVATGHSLPRNDEPTAAEKEEQAKDYTLRGQVLRIRAPWRAPIGISRVNEEGFRDVYCLPFSDGTVVVGGTRVPNDVDPHPQDDVTDAILTHVLPIIPDLRKPDADPTAPLREQVDIFAVGVGLRPSRKGGPRIERDSSGLDGAELVWCYGFGGTGYQSSWGSAFRVTEVLEPTLRRS